MGISRNRGEKSEVALEILFAENIPTIRTPIEDNL
jgi:hypothetical protein